MEIGLAKRRSENLYLFLPHLVCLLLVVCRAAPYRDQGKRVFVEHTLHVEPRSTLFIQHLELPYVVSTLKAGKECSYLHYY